MIFIVYICGISLAVNLVFYFFYIKKEKSVVRTMTITEHAELEKFNPKTVEEWIDHQDGGNLYNIRDDGSFERLK